MIFGTFTGGSITNTLSNVFFVSGNALLDADINVTGASTYTNPH